MPNIGLQAIDQIEAPRADSLPEIGYDQQTYDYIHQILIKIGVLDQVTKVIEAEKITNTENLSNFLCALFAANVIGVLWEDSEEKTVSVQEITAVTIREVNRLITDYTQDSRERPLSAFLEKADASLASIFSPDSQATSS